MSTADNGTLMCISKGDLVLNNSILATTVLYCPQVSLNLIATSQLCNLGFTLEMDKTRIVVKEKTKVVLIVLKNRWSILVQYPARKSSTPKRL